MSNEPSVPHLIRRWTWAGGRKWQMPRQLELGTHFIVVDKKCFRTHISLLWTQEGSALCIKKSPVEFVYHRVFVRDSRQRAGTIWTQCYCVIEDRGVCANVSVLGNFLYDWKIAQSHIRTLAPGKKTYKIWNKTANIQWCKPSIQSRWKKNTQYKTGCTKKMQLTLQKQLSFWWTARCKLSTL